MIWVISERQGGMLVRHFSQIKYRNCVNNLEHPLCSDIL